MPRPHIFALPNAQGDDYILPTTLLGRPRKRKRKTEGEGEADGDGATFAPESAGSDGESAAGLLASSAYTVLTANELEQIRTAGLEPGEERPEYPFPHTTKIQRGYVLSDVRRELRDLNPPLAHLDPSYYEPLPFKTNQDRAALREQHVAVLTTLLHQMLQRGDYERAGRAWGLLLRSGYLTRDIKSKTGLRRMDVRTHERWGIGAELLLRRTSGDDLYDDGSSSQPDFSDEAFLKARQYYDRLIIQYPLHHNRKGAQGSTFYAAMFSLWLYEISQRHKSAPDEPMEIPSSPTQRSENAAYQDFKAISAKLDEVLTTPPYDSNPELLQMRGMIALWAADLFGSQYHRDAVKFFEKAKYNGAQLAPHAEDLVKVHGREGIGEDGSSSPSRG